MTHNLTPSDASIAIREVQLLRAQNAQLVMILEMSDTGVLHADANGVVVSVNRALRRMFAIDEHGHNKLTLLAFERNLKAMLDSSEQIKEPISALKLLMASNSGEQVSHATRTIYLAAPRRAVIQIKASATPERGCIFYFRDITAEFEVDRMRSEFLSTAAHELRTPLASIFGFAEILIARVLKPELQRELLQTIHRQTKLLTNLINELLDLSRIESRQGKDFHRQHCRVENVVQQTIQDLLVKGDKRQITLKMTHGQERIMVDMEKTMQALLNVLSNAFKYSPNGGSIGLKTVMREEEGEREVGICVSDSGLGMSPEHLSRIFERFFRADPSGDIPGTGLGMSLVKEIVELQDGRVQVESVLGRGTAVTLWFPLASDFLLSQPSPFLDE
ncbi:MAG: hypothetical protein RIR45_734 [Pseudomonadota bacterium]|jgi:signal transduction histidine kinase